MGAFWRVLVVSAFIFSVGAVGSPYPSVTVDAPAGSEGWHAALRPRHLRHLSARTEDAATSHSACPNASWAAASQVAGLLSVKLFGAVGDGSHDDAPAVEAAMNASALCGGCVFFPPTDRTYRFAKTVGLRGCIKGGGGGGGAQNQMRPSVEISGPASGPTVSISGGDIYVQDLTFNGGTLAVYIANAAVVRFVNVGAQITEMGTGIDKVDSTAEGCNRTACNVVLGSMNAAMVVENSFWLWFEHCSFTAQSNSGECARPYKQPCGWGQRPSVILRGQTAPTMPEVLDDKKGYAIAEVYLVRFDRIIFTGGGVQYQQLVADPGGAPAGWFDFVSCTQEVSATPLLDLQSASFKGYFPGLSQIVIRDYMAADQVLKPRFGVGTPTIIAVNCSASGCELDGVSISSAGLDTPNAVRVYKGTVASVVIEGAARGIYSAHGVADQNGLPTGIWRQTDGAGWKMSGKGHIPALSFLVSGEAKPRKTINADGSEQVTGSCCHADTERTTAEGESSETSVLCGHLTNTSSWDPPALAIGGVATSQIGLTGIAPGDAVSVGLSSVTLEHSVLLSATAGQDVVKVVLQNVGLEATDILEGTLRVVVAKML